MYISDFKIMILQKNTRQHSEALKSLFGCPVGSADVLSGRRFVRTALDVLSGRRFVRTGLDVLSGPICATFFQADQLRRFVRKTFCQDRFVRHFFQVDRLRRFVRKTFCQDRLTGGHILGIS